ncbi:MAG: DinB family protein [Candidatus Kariarchaeaceae archaeon]|jgi:hypothetical protein
MEITKNNFDIEKSIEILERTPRVLAELLGGLSDSWISVNEGGDSWSPFDIVGHYIHGEYTDWIPRAKIIMSEQQNKTFESFDRFAQIESSKNKSISELLDEFAKIRAMKINEFRDMNINNNSLKKVGMHPELGEVNLQQLLATWVVHDLSHLSHILRIIANQYKEEVGPWIKYLRILNY